MSRLEDITQHEAVVDQLIERLKASGRYARVWKHFEYARGEADVLTLNEHGVHYYEIKCHNHPNSFGRAQKQFEKFKAFFPTVEAKFIYVTGTNVRRVYV